MKTWICICAVMFASGAAVLADEPKTNAPATATAISPSGTNPAAIPVAPAANPTTTAAAPLKPKPLPVPATNQNSSVPAAPKMATASPRAANVSAPASVNSGTNSKVSGGIPPSLVVETSAPAVVNQMTPTNSDSSMSETSAVPAQADSAAPNPAGPGAEIAGTSHKAVAALIVIFLVVAGILAVFLWQRSHIDRQGSLITRALNKDKENPPPSL